MEKLTKAAQRDLILLGDGRDAKMCYGPYSQLFMAGYITGEQDDR